MKNNLLRSGTMNSVFDDYYVIQNKVWWGWKNIFKTYSKDALLRKKEYLEGKGYVFLN